TDEPNEGRCGATLASPESPTWGPRRAASGTGRASPGVASGPARGAVRWGAEGCRRGRRRGAGATGGVLRAGSPRRRATGRVVGGGPCADYDRMVPEELAGVLRPRVPGMTPRRHPLLHAVGRP